MQDQKKLLKDRGICVVIPVYNNEKTIGDVVRRSMENCLDVIVVNDGSTDTTGDVLHSIEGITIVEYPKNQGKGHALRCGFRKALELGFAYVITIDGDGQHYPEDIVNFLNANIEHPGAILVGDRNMEGVQRSKGSSFANKFSNFWFTVQTFKKVDAQSGYRLYPIKKLYGLSLISARYEAELELLVIPSWHGVQIYSVPIRVYYPPANERVSHFRPAKDFTRISILNTILCIVGLVYALPLGILRFIFKYLRTAYAALVFVFFSLFVLTPYVWFLVKIGKMTEQKQLKLHKFIQKSMRVVMLVHGIPGAKFSYKVADGVSMEQPRVVICNHQSHLDLMCQLIFTPKIIFLTNNWVWNNPFFGFMVRHAEYYPVAEGIDNLMPKLADLVKRGYNIAIFPEGTRSKDCKIGRFHRGAFYIAEQLGLEILPMCLYGTGKVLPKNKYVLQKNPIYIEIEKPLTRSELDAMGTPMQQASCMQKRYVERYADICNQMEQNV
ncbi:MAG: glycosyltransferase [Bacteroidales bacterium]|nr:glycosyltransferase [Bacteroidales bacterium]